VQVPKKAPKRGDSDLQSIMEAPIEAVAGDTRSVMIAVGQDKPEKISLKDDISVNPQLALAPEDKTAILTQLYERSLCEGGVFERKSVSFDDDISDAIRCDVMNTKIDEPSVRSNKTPRVTVPRPTTPETVQDQGQEVDINQVLSSKKSRSIFSSKKNKVSLRKKVSFPALKKTKSKASNVRGRNYQLDSIDEGGELFPANEEAQIPVAYLAKSESEETGENEAARYAMAPDKGGIFAAISNTESGIMEAWDQISRKYSIDPNWDTNTSVSSRDFENTSFQCLGPTCVSTMSESHASDDGDTDVDEASAEDTDCSSSEYMTQYTESEYMSQFTNPSTNASLSTASYSCESASTMSEDGYSR
jgi:predicted DNA binding CopG/RHH family protein